MHSSSRRNWIKKSALGIGAVAATPFTTWANRVVIANETNSTFLHPETFPFNEFTPPYILPEKPLAILAWNENPYGFSPMALEAINESTSKANRYGWQDLMGLKKVIAEKEGVNPSNIMLGPGSTDLLERTSVYCFRDGGNVISADPAYMSVISVAQASGATWKAIKLTENYEHDLEGMELAMDKETKLVYIANPNNPTGSKTNRNDLYEFCAKVSKKAPVFVDEAYLEFSKNGLEDSMVDLVKKGKNVIISRTFSKIYGMAGMRCGYIVAHEDLITELSNFTIPGFGISSPTIIAAQVALDDKEHLHKCRTDILEYRDITIKYLITKNINYIPSEANFVIFEINMDGTKFTEEMYNSGIVIRTFKFWDKTWCRVTIGTDDEMRVFFNAMDKIYRK
ncbi:histidinol-phosphate aminotransferase [Neptunitalea chrysea]|uniref:Histidinol-phosphate aminotransferase n=1 Tax=Neptunitalea chrysea TaxID=1647581 RepID=A0A9W6B3Z7_9FLAO|nr:histidinol-phosphate transaminase [Neptunitalea chrysea]GLB51377.1 histidinol-phosphate aminotransferase [Neptunitalea chrysea]